MHMRGILPHFVLLACLGAGACVELAEPVRPGLRQEAPDDSTAALYERDAGVLALRHVDDVGGDAATRVELPATLLASFEAALRAVHELDHPARDSVVEIYPIHAFPTMNPFEIYVGLEPGAPWAGAWQEGHQRTGEPAVDTLVERYGLVVERTHSVGITPLFILRSEEPLNTPALAARFEAVEGVRYAGTNGYGGDGADMRARPAPDGGWWLEYSVGWGDCPAGCIERHVWTFRVTAGGSASYEGSSGPAIPDHMPPL